MSDSGPPLPRIVSDEEWRRALAELRAEEKAVTRRLDALAARRRRLPMTSVDPGYRFLGDSPGLELEDGLIASLGVDRRLNPKLSA